MRRDFSDSSYVEAIYCKLSAGYYYFNNASKGRSKRKRAKNARTPVDPSFVRCLRSRAVSIARAAFGLERASWRAGRGIGIPIGDVLTDVNK